MRVTKMLRPKTLRLLCATNPWMAWIIHSGWTFTGERGVDKARHGCHLQNLFKATEQTRERERDVHTHSDTQSLLCFSV